MKKKILFATAVILLLLGALFWKSYAKQQKEEVEIIEVFKTFKSVYIPRDPDLWQVENIKKEKIIDNVTNVFYGQIEAYLGLKKVLNIDEAKKLLSHPNNIVKTYAYFIYCDKTGSCNYDYLLKSFDKKSNVIFTDYNPSMAIVEFECLFYEPLLLAALGKINIVKPTDLTIEQALLLHDVYQKDSLYSDLKGYVEEAFYHFFCDHNLSIP